MKTTTLALVLFAVTVPGLAHAGAPSASQVAQHFKGALTEGDVSAPASTKSLGDLTLELKSLQEQHEAVGGVPGLGFLIGGGTMIVVGAVTAFASALLWILVGGITRAFTGGAAMAFSTGYIAVIIAGAGVAIVGAILFTVGVVKLVAGIKTKRALNVQMEDIEKQIERLKSENPAAPTAHLLGAPVPSMTLATF